MFKESIRERQGEVAKRRTEINYPGKNVLRNTGERERATRIVTSVDIKRDAARETKRE